jgi:hypothetical protein
MKEEGMDEEDTTISKMIDSYIALRDKKEGLKKEHSAVIKKYDDAMDQIENYLSGQLQSQKLQSMSCSTGVVYFKRVTSATVADTGVFREHVISTGNFDLADFRAKKEAVEDYAKENDGRLPPGVNFRASQAVFINRK